ncbi:MULTISPECIES: GntR family transcriptional regulator [unclassified Actinotalea]|uniref:GntR family transcriptional regulator n=1 Tax=unclassified Actinotalea TaxID=2638618 RepID=UPI0015F4F168|nr:MULTISPECIES: GntR family transcriptional regulator [unclassified Actinotalea]
MSSLTPLPQVARVADTVYATLRGAILEGGLAPGSRLSVPQLAQQLAVSRSPVREAVQRLVQDGLATEEPHRGAVVAVLDPSELLPLYEVREVLEGLSARLAAERGTPEEIETLREAYDRHAEALAGGASDQHVPLDLAFHAALRAAAHNSELHTSLDRVQGKIAVAMLGGDPANWSHQAIKEHHAILQAVVDRRPDEAEQAARAHIVRIRHDIAARFAVPDRPAGT